jgi:hypothetical protein
VNRTEADDGLTGRLPAVDHVTPERLRLEVAMGAAEHRHGFLVGEKAVILPDDAERRRRL